MSEVPDESVHFIVTSPPYFSAIEYNRDNPNNIGNYDGKSYFALVKDVYTECFRMLKPGRRMVINVQDIPSTPDCPDGLDLLGFKTFQVCQEIGFVLKSNIIWHKGFNGAAGAPMGSVPYPGGVCVLHNYEHNLVFWKPGKPEYPKDHDIREESKLVTKEIGEFVAKAVWDMKCETNSPHPAPYPLELPRRMIKLYSFVGETVLDPFAGSGTTLKVAHDLKRSCWGYELEEKFIPMIKDKVGWNQQFIDDERQYTYEVIKQGVVQLDNPTECRNEEVKVKAEEKDELQKKIDELFG